MLLCTRSCFARSPDLRRKTLGPARSCGGYEARVWCRSSFLARFGIPLPHYLLCRFAIYAKAGIAFRLFQAIQIGRPVPPGKTNKPRLVPESFYRRLVVSALFVTIVNQIRVRMGPGSSTTTPCTAHSHFNEKNWTVEFLTYSSEPFLYWFPAEL